jgi:AbrB family looped-hinge helix DNA binding protein
MTPRAFLFQHPVQRQPFRFLGFTSTIYQNKMAYMAVQTTLDKAGRIVLPKPLRDELNLSPGDTLEVSVAREQITMRPLRISSPLQKERGVWVFRTGEKLAQATVDQTIRQVREDRHHAALGPAD